MKKLFYFTIILSLNLLAVGSIFAQKGQWTWVSGENTLGFAGNFGVKGIPSITNEPPALYEACQWKDLNGNLWFFGGEDKFGQAMSDLWEYNPSTLEWTWIGGHAVENDPGSYGIQGLSSPNNYPPARLYAYSSWTDLQGNLWMFGGYEFSDLWKFDISSGEWTWMSGPNTKFNVGVYGTKGVPSVNNYPHNRCEMAANWVDDSGDLWLYGGLIAGSNGAQSDLWRYTIATNEWTWMQGPQFTGFPAVYGTQGVENSANTPGGRWVYTHWKDNKGNFWLFGGENGAQHYFNDLWRYNPLTNNWAWIDGPNTPNGKGVYGTQCVFAPGNIPGSRFEDRATWTDQDGNFWLFGGALEGYDTTWNDLWKYCVSSNQWAWISGSSGVNDPGNWGTMGVSSPTNVPSGRAGSDSWYIPDTAGGGLLYLFGGDAVGGVFTYNDLWKFTIDPNCGGTCAAVVAPPVISFQSSDTSLCQYDCINFANHSTNATSWKWSFPGGTPSSSSDQNPTNICYYTAGNYDVTLIASNGGASDTLTTTNLIKVFPTPPFPNITQSHDTLFCSTNASYVSYQWYDSTVLVSGATDTFFVATHNGNYNIAVKDINGCVISVGINILALPPVGAFQSSSTTICERSCINFTDKSTGTPLAWYWTFPGGTPSSSSDQNPQQICYPNAGVYKVTLVATNTAGSDTVVVNNLIHVNQSPVVPVITRSNDTLYCNIDPSYTSYQWYLDTTLIIGATNSFYVSVQGGNYHVEVHNENGCSSSANIAVGLAEYAMDNAIYVYPNPAGDQIMIDGLNLNKETIVDIYNVLGQIVQKEKVSRSNLVTINIKNLSAGVYFIVVPAAYEKGMLVGKFVKK